ncbi:hypothetical protein [Flaviaesturariibacter amylovorans]|uniref:Uncharacterized protein n=1 Tax=Flaviaesturariibacter amylovorans TaxID=1084520 RepID=A0ABP8HP90_9BACT
MADSLDQQLRGLNALMTEEDAHFVRLAASLNERIVEDFDSVVRLLYRVDVPEKRVRAALAAGGGDAGTILARLLLEREREKAASRARYRMPDEDIPEEDRW